MDAYSPLLGPTPTPSMSCACVPRSTMLPASITTMTSHDRTVDRRCATNTAVRPSATSCSDCRMPTSVAVSSALVASSASSSRGERRNARAIATRCFSPPESFTPLSPTIVCKPSGMAAKVLSSRASLAALSTSSSLAPARPYRRLCRNVSLNSTVSCGTTAVMDRNESCFKSRTSTPSISTLPPVTSYMRSKSLSKVLLPLPDGPTMPTL